MLTNVCVYLREITAVISAFSDMRLHDDGLYQVLKVHTPASQTFQISHEKKRRLCSHFE